MVQEPIFTVSYSGKVNLTVEDIDDIMSGALDYISYWCRRAKVVGEYLGEYASEQIARGGTLILYDAESSDKWELTRDKFLKGFQLWLENGMDIKSLSAMLGHISSETTIDIYSHVTDTMRQQAAAKIDRQISGTEAEIPRAEERSRVDTTPPDFEPYKPKCRKSGTGCVTMINNHLYEGRYTPANAYGKREAHNIYAKTREECEEKLAAMITQVKADIKAEKKRLKAMEESSPTMFKN